MSRSSKLIFLGILALGFTLLSCKLQTFGAPQVDTPSDSTVEPTLAFVPTAIPPSQPLRALTICLGQEPNTLYINDNPNPAALSVLEGIYDGPLDSRDYGYQPIILQKVPSFANGDMRLESIPVEEGDWVIDFEGNLVELFEGTRVYPSGCQEASCVATFKDNITLNMDQMVVHFSFLPDLRWADGAPLSADDSVYAFDLAIASKNPADKYLLERTASYESVDDITTAWRGLPGYRDNSYMTNFWLPMPYHLWSELSPSELVDSDIASRFPIGWGAYIIDEWIPTESITLIKNPLYHRASEGLPKVDIIKFLFVSSPDIAIAALLDGECDLLDPGISLERQVDLLRQLDISGEIQFYATEKMSLESLHIGINPASYDDGMIARKDRPEFFSDPRTRQALALCLNRQEVVDTVLHGLSTVPDSYIPNAHPLYTSDINLYSFSTNAGSSLLDDIGWKDIDKDPSTPRTAYNVKNVPAETLLELDYITTDSLQRRQVSEILAKSLRSCGIGINLHYLPPEEFYAPGPEGILFGRNFDLAQLGMGTESLVPHCDWFSRISIPDFGNDWFGENLSGFSNSNYDEACNKAIFTLPNAQDFVQNYQKTLSIYAEELPSIPLYAYPQLAASHVDLSGFSLNPSAQNWLWNIEEIYIVGKAQMPITNTPLPKATSTLATSSPPINTATSEPSYPNPTNTPDN